MSEITQYFGLKCYDSCLAHIVAEEGGQAEYYFGHMWRIPWGQGQLLGSKLRFETDIRSLLERYSGLQGIKIEEMNPDKWKYEKGKYTILEVDTYFYPLHRLYHVEHTNHFCLYAGIENNMAKVIDPMLSDTIGCIPAEEIRSGFLSSENLSIENVLCLSGEILRKDIWEYYSKSEDCKNIDRILAYLCEDFDLQKEFEGLRDRKYDIPLYRSLWAIMFSRKLYSDLLSKMSEDYSELICMLESIFEEWQTIRGQLAKLYYQKRKKLDSDSFEMISNVLNKEKAAYSLNLRLLNGE